jgi:hypothetical protein
MEMWALQETINHKSFYRMFSLGKENQYGQRNLTLARGSFRRQLKHYVFCKRQLITKVSIVCFLWEKKINMDNEILH